jgi:lipopolysaccharide transport system permease protein
METNTHLKERIYTPDSKLKHPLKFLKEMLDDIKISRELAWTLFKRNIKAQYRQTILGYVWAFIPPIFTTLIFLFLSKNKIINVTDTVVPYPVFLMVGTILWQVFLEAVNIPIKLMMEARHILTKIYFPREALILAAFYEVVFTFTIRLVLMAAILIIYKVPVKILILLSPIGIFSLILLGVMFSLLIIPAVILYKDFEKGLPLVMQMWFFLTPVIFSPFKEGMSNILYYINPVIPLLNTTREMITTGVITRWDLFALILVLSSILFSIGLLLYRIALPHLVGRIGS